MTKTLIALLFIFACGSAHARFVYNDKKEILPYAIESLDQMDLKMLSKSDPQAELYKNAGKLEQIEGFTSSVCTGALVDSSEFLKENPLAPAYVVTAGHCYMDAVTSIVTNQPLGEGNSIFFSDFFDARSVKVKVDEVAYATRHGNDLALLKLSRSYAALAKAGYKGFKLASVLPKEGSAIEMLGSPGAFKPDDSIAFPRKRMFMHHVTAEMSGLRSNDGKFAGDENYYFQKEFIQFNGSAFPGCSGGPVFTQSGHEIFGVNSSVQDQLVDPELLKNYIGYNLAGDATPVRSCLDAKGIFSLEVPGCRLEKNCDGVECQKQLCAAGNGLRCFEVGDFENGCKLGDAFSCVAQVNKDVGIENLIQFDAKVIAARKDLDFKALASKLWTACEHGMAQACDTLLRFALIAPKLAISPFRNEAQLLTQLDFSCKRGGMWSCLMLGAHYADPFKEDLTKAARYLNTVCVASQTESICERFADVLVKKGDVALAEKARALPKQNNVIKPQFQSFWDTPTW